MGGKNEAGVSLVEIMICLVLVAIALVAITAVFPNVTKHRKGIHEAEQAKIIAVEALEFLQFYPCKEINAGDGNVDFNDKYSADHPIDMGSVTYTVEKSTVTCDNEINTADVYVMWEKSGKSHKVTVTGALR